MDELRQQARKLWEDSSGKKPLKEIAAELGIAEGTLRSWKKRDAWGRNVAPLRADATQREKQRRRRAQINRKAAEAIENNEALTDRERNFCAAFVHAPNPTQAALKTGSYSTYASARQQAYIMMQKPAVLEEIKRLKAIKRAALLADADDVIEMHMRIAFADMSDIAKWRGSSIQLLPADQADGQIIQEVSEGREGLKVKLFDKQKSLDFLERYFEINPMDRHKKAFDNARLELERRRQEIGNEDALEKLDSILFGLKQVMQDET